MMTLFSRPFALVAACLLIAACGESTTTDVETYYNTLPPEIRQLPMALVQPQLVDQLINQKLMAQAGRDAGLDNDERVKRGLAAAEEELLQRYWVFDTIEAAMTDERLQGAYDEMVADFTPEAEIQARHILLETKDEADAVIAELNDGAIFNDLARERSIGPSGPNGGDLGYFTAERMVPEFSAAAFALEIGEHSKEPVQTQFGWHVIKVEDARETRPLSFEEAKATLQAEEADIIYRELIDGLKADATIERIEVEPVIIEEPLGDLPPADGNSAP